LARYILYLTPSVALTQTPTERDTKGVIIFAFYETDSSGVLWKGVKGGKAE